MPDLTPLWALTGQLGITVVSAVAVAYGAFRYFGDKWITGKFNQSLEAFKHRQQAELEQVRLKINTAFDRTVKLHINEFEVLPELWSLLNTAFDATSVLASPIQSKLLLDRLDDAEIDEFLAESALSNREKKLIKASHSRSDDYFDMQFWKRHDRAQQTLSDFQMYFSRKGIFIDDDVKTPTSDLMELLWETIIEQEAEKRHDNPRENRFQTRTEFIKSGRNKLSAIEVVIAKKLRAGASA